MNLNMVNPLPPAQRGRVIALPCSGADAGQWRYLAEALGGRYELFAPEHYGCESTGPHAFTLADDAAPAIALIDDSEGKVHLVGRSYGGGVALHLALARPNQVASMALYEPSAFHSLRQMGERGAAAFAEIATVAHCIGKGVLTGEYRKAVASFVDYWNGRGTWNAMRPAVQNGLIRWAPKGPLDFRALIEEPTPAEAYRTLTFPCSFCVASTHRRRPV
jgi:pimeloyl-ACP methyl ester carboxylesterase